MGAFLNGKDTACLHDNDSRVLVLYLGAFIALLLKSTLRLFGMAQLNYFFYSDLKTSDLNDLRGHLRSFEAV